LLLRKQGGYLSILKEDVEIIDINTERIRHSLKPILREIYSRKPDIVFSGFGEVNAYLSLFIKVFPRTKLLQEKPMLFLSTLPERKSIFLQFLQ
jgi:hypothetical protein